MGRPLTDAEKQKRRVNKARRLAIKIAAEKTQAVRDELGPLFIGQAEVFAPSVVDEWLLYWKWRRDIARNVEHHERHLSAAAKALDRITVSKRERQALQLLDPVTFARWQARALSMASYGPEYALDNWYQALKDVSGLREEILAEHKRFDTRRGPEPLDDGGLMERLQKLLHRDMKDDT